jgi:SAM-dependent methyltransferase
MNNIWLEINLDDYEKHMSLPSIGQSQYLSDYFEKILAIYNPASIAILGCFGGNGLEKINPEKVQKVVGVDINPKYLETTKIRYLDSFKDIKFICCDISVDGCYFKPVELMFAGLIFEYVDHELALKNISKLIKNEGRLVVVLQLPNTDIPEVSPSPYKSLEKLNEIFSFVSPNKFIELSELYGLKLISKNQVKLASGKEFIELILQKK